MSSTYPTMAKSAFGRREWIMVAIATLKRATEHGLHYHLFGMVI
jgi:hypothetical protein